MVRTVRILLLYKSIYLQINYCAMFSAFAYQSFEVLWASHFLSQHMVQPIISWKTCCLHHYVSKADLLPCCEFAFSLYLSFQQNWQKDCDFLYRTH